MGLHGELSWTAWALHGDYMGTAGGLAWDYTALSLPYVAAHCSDIASALSAPLHCKLLLFTVMDETATNLAKGLSISIKMQHLFP